MKKIIILSGLIVMLASAANAQIVFEFPQSGNDWRRDSDDRYWRQIRFNQEAEELARERVRFDNEAEERHRHDVYENEHHDNGNHYAYGKRNHKKNSPKHYNKR